MQIFRKIKMTLNDLKDNVVNEFSTTLKRNPIGAVALMGYGVLLIVLALMQCVYYNSK